MKRFLSLLLAALMLLSLADAAFAAAETTVAVLEPTLRTDQLDKKLYDKLLKRLDAKLNKKNFTELEKSFFRDLLEVQMRCYAQWCVVYPDLPSVEDFVQENLIDATAKLKTLRSYDVLTEEGAKIESETDWSGQTFTGWDGSVIDLLYTNPMVASERGHRKDLSVLAHELRHVHDRKSIMFSIFPSISMNDMFIEGGASFHDNMVFPVSVEEDYAEFVTANNGRTMSFQREIAAGYPMYQSFYEGLVYLAGYRVVNAVGAGKDPGALWLAIAKRYGRGTANTFWNLLQQVPLQDELFEKGEQTFRLGLQYFRLLLDCVKSDIASLNKNQPQQVRSFLEVYRHLKLCTLPKVADKNGNDITAKVFKTDVTDRLITERVLSSGALGKLYESRAMSERAVMEMLYNSRGTFDDDDIYYCYLPPTIAQTQYTFRLRKGKGVMVMRFKSGRGQKTKSCIRFNENKMLKFAGTFSDY